MRETTIPPGLLDALPILALRNSVLFPASVVPVNVGRTRSVRLIEEISEMERPTVGVVAQLEPQTEDPDFDQVHRVGTLARMLKVIRLSSGNYSVVLQGIGRMRIGEALSRDPCLRAKVERLEEPRLRNEEINALVALVRESARELAELVPEQPQDIGAVLQNVQEPGALADLVASNLQVSTEQKQRILETVELRARLRRVHELLKRQSAIYRVRKEIATLVEEGMSGSQRELLLRQQMKAIRRELGDAGDEDDDIELLRERMAKAEASPEVAKAARRELSRMSSMSSHSAEYQVAFGYVTWLADMPWSVLTPDRLDIEEVRRVLDEDHHGLQNAKRRIVEYVAVRKLQKEKKGPILCFVGPPGVGKSSLARSIGRATGRNIARVSLGGVQDEAEIRGHRRTYVGAMPGRIVAGLKRAGTRNPVFILDEIDKMSADFSGDPAAALLEVLDPEQNYAFVDHYLNLPLDLSQVLFVATANRQDKIPRALLDRMEILELPGYLRDEKLAIARDFLAPRQLSEHGLTPEQLEFTDAAVERVIDEYTDEAGVRQLERELAALCRAVAVRLANGEDVSVVAGRDFVEEVLGPPRFTLDSAEKVLSPGISTSLMWTPSGGDVLLVECSQMPGRGRVWLTGQMGEVMKESAAAAFAYVRSRASRFNLDENFLETIDVHIHLPKAGIPKDGPAAGLSVFVSLVSMLTGTRARPDVAVTGEITLRGAVLRVEGLRQKCLAAHRAGIKHVVLPRQNQAEVEEIPDSIRGDLQLHLIHRIEEVLPIVLHESDVATEPAHAPGSPPP